MAGKVIDVTLKLIDQLSSPLSTAGENLKNSANQWTKAGKQIEKTGKTITNAGKTMTSTVTAPIVAAGTASVSLATDFEAGMSNVQAISGATSSQLEELSNKAIEMGGKTKFSASEASDAFSYMAMAGWKTEDMLDGIEGVMYLAGATGEDLASTSDIVTDSLTAFGMSALDTNEFVNVLAATANNSNTNVSMLGEAFKYCAPMAGALNFSIQDVSTALGTMANAGIKASQGGTALRTLFTNLSSGEKSGILEGMGISESDIMDSEGNLKSLSEIIEVLRNSFNNMSSSSEKSSYAFKLAGKTGESALLALMNTPDEDYNKLADAVNNSTDACKNMYDVANDNLEGQLTTIKSTLESIGIILGNILIPYVKKAAEFIQGLLDKFNNLSPGVKKVIVKIAGIAAAIGPGLIAFGAMTKGVGKVVGAVGKFGKALKTFGSVKAVIKAALLSPSAIAIGVVAALIVVIVLLVKNWDKVKEAIKKVGKWLERFKIYAVKAQYAISKFKDSMQPVIEKLKHMREKIAELYEKAKPYLDKIAEVVEEVFTGVVKTAISTAVENFETLLETVSAVIDGVVSVLDGIITFISGVFAGDWEEAWNGIQEIFSGIFEAIVGIAKGVINTIINGVNTVITGANNMAWAFGSDEDAPVAHTIPTLATGSTNWKGGLVQISEKGGEIVDLPSGSRVYPHDSSVQQAYADGARSVGSGISISIPKLADSIIVREDADIDKIATKLADKLEKVSLNCGGGEIGYLY